MEIHWLMKLQRLRTLCLLALSVPAIGAAQSLEELGQLPPEERRAYWQSMSEDEREAKVAEWRAQLDALTPEEREALRTMLQARREEMRAEWDTMSEEERAAARARMRERVDNMSPEEREAMRELMQEQRKSMTREERRALRDKRREQAAEPAETPE